MHVHGGQIKLLFTWHSVISFNGMITMRFARFESGGQSFLQNSLESFLLFGIELLLLLGITLTEINTDVVVVGLSS